MVQASSTLCNGRSREELQEPAAGLASDPCLPWQNSWTGVGFSNASPVRVLSLNRGRVPESPVAGIEGRGRRPPAAAAEAEVAHHDHNHPASEVHQRGDGG